MWDGIRRAWLWFRGILEKAEPMLNWARNLARLAYRYALHVFETIKDLVDKVIESAQFFVNPTVPGSDPPHFVIYRDNTFDYYLHASDRSQAYRLRELSQKMLKQSRYFSLGFRVARSPSGK